MAIIVGNYTTVHGTVAKLSYHVITNMTTRIGENPNTTCRVKIYNSKADFQAGREPLEESTFDFNMLMKQNPTFSKNNILDVVPGTLAASTATNSECNPLAQAYGHLKAANTAVQSIGGSDKSGNQDYGSGSDDTDDIPAGI